MGELASARSMTASGIVDDAEKNARVIPQSRRADGSIRKERRVKPGFVPLEDVARFVPSRVRQAQVERATTPTAGRPTRLTRGIANDRQLADTSSATSAGTSHDASTSSPVRSSTPMHTDADSRTTFKAQDTTVSKDAKSIDRKDADKKATQTSGQPSTAKTSVPDAWDEDEANGSLDDVVKDLNALKVTPS